MNTDTRSFLETLLWTAQLDEASPEDFSPESITAAETYLETLRERMEEDPEIESALESATRSFGGNAYLSGSGHGAGFWDEPENGDTLQASYEAISGKYRFEGLDGLLDVDPETGRIDIAILPEFIADYRAKLFALSTQS